MLRKVSKKLNFKSKETAKLVRGERSVYPCHCVSNERELFDKHPLTKAVENFVLKHSKKTASSQSKTNEPTQNISNDPAKKSFD